MIQNSLIDFHKHKMWSAKKNNIILHLNIHDWQSLEKWNDKEVSIQGKMFDIQELSFAKNEVVLKGHFDVKEDQLISNQKDFQKKHKGYAFSFLSFFMQHIEPFQIRYFPKATSIIYFDHYHPLFFRPNNIELPPPNFFS